MSNSSSFVHAEPKCDVLDSKVQDLAHVSLAVCNALDGTAVVLSKQERRNKIWSTY